MKRFLIGLALCFMPVFSFALPVCEEGKISFTCSEDGQNKECQFYQYFAGAARDCELPDKYKDENGRACFKNGDISPCEKHNDDGKQPKTDKPPEEGKTPKQPPTGGKCYIESVEGGVCRSMGWRYTILNPHLPGGYTCSNSYWLKQQTGCPKREQQKEPKQPNPNDGKQPKNEEGKQQKHDEGKQPKGEGQGDSSSEGNGKGSKDEGSGKGEGSGDGSGKGSKGEGNGKGEGSGDGNGKGSKGEGEGKGMFKGGAGSGQLGDVRVPKSRDGMGWKGDFFLRNPNQCPQDKTMHVLGRSITFSYAKLCGFLDMLSPVIKAVFMFISGMLVVKSIRAK